MLSARGGDGGPYALVLAAGQGRRFGGEKLLALLDGRPLLEHLLETVRQAETRGVLAGCAAVVPAGSERLIALARRYESMVVENDAPAKGLSRSLRLGLSALAESRLGPRPTAAVILLGDQPRVSFEAVEKVVAAWRSAPGGIVRARYSNQPDLPGHPLLIDRAVWPLAEALEGDGGFGPMLRAHPEMVVSVDVAGANPDVDTPADLHFLEERTR